MAESNKTNTVARPVLVILFFIIIGGLAFAAVQLVQWAPGGFDRVAALAERVNDSQQTILDFGDNTELEAIILTDNTTYTTSGESIELSWPSLTEPGSYFFLYQCTDGVTIELDLDNQMEEITCGSQYNLGDTDIAALVVTSDVDRYADLAYEITFIPEGQQMATAAGAEMITIVNNDVSTLFADNTESEPTTSTPTPQPTPTVDDEAVTTDFGFTNNAPGTEPSPIVAGATDTTPPPTYTPVENVITIIPPSDENGNTDLATRFIATGNIIGDTFFAQDIIKDHRGAVQFEVKNLGTKTSDDWTYSLTLPNGSTYTSPSQAPLKPNERALITIGFPTPAITDYQVTVVVETSGDSTNLNDSFTKQVALVN